MGGTPILGIVLGVTLVSPQLMNAYLLGQQTPDVWNFGVFSIEKIGYRRRLSRRYWQDWRLDLLKRG